jgi:mRNA interferase MazF
MKAGEIWLVNFWPSVGAEMTKAGPAVVVGSDDIGSLDLRIVVPFTDAKQVQRRWHVKIKPTSLNKLRKESLLDCFQIKSVSIDRVIKKIGKLSDADLDDIKICLVKVLDLL